MTTSRESGLQLGHRLDSSTDELLLTSGYVRVTSLAAADEQPRKFWVIQQSLRTSNIIRRHTVIWFLNVDII